MPKRIVGDERIGKAVAKRPEQFAGVGARALEVLDLQFVVAGIEVDLAFAPRGRMTSPPVVDQLLAVDPKPAAVVEEQGNSIVARLLSLDQTCPARAKIKKGNSCRKLRPRVRMEIHRVVDV